MISLCANNQRLISIGLSSHLSDSNKKLPIHSNWGTLIGVEGVQNIDNEGDRLLNRYLEDPLETAKCPVDQGDSFNENKNSKNLSVFAFFGTSYLPQWNVDNFATLKVTSAKNPLDIYSFEFPDKKLFLADWIWHMNRQINDKRTHWHSSEKRLCNTLFLDGHVELFEFPLTMERNTPADKDTFGWY